MLFMLIWWICSVNVGCGDMVDMVDMVICGVNIWFFVCVTLRDKKVCFQTYSFIL
jgi:hypothetical protein